MGKGTVEARVTGAGAAAGDPGAAEAVSAGAAGTASAEPAGALTMGEAGPVSVGEAGAASAEEAGAGLGSQIVRFVRLVAARRHQAKLEQGAGERVLLARLVREGEQRATDLAADTFLDLSTVSRQVRSMVERGLIERRPDPQDRRGTLLYATESGRAVYETYRRQRDAQLAELLAPWPPEDRYQLIRLMARLNDDLVAHQQNRHGDGARPGVVTQQGARTYE